MCRVNIRTFSPHYIDLPVFCLGQAILSISWIVFWWALISHTVRGGIGYQPLTIFTSWVHKDFRLYYKKYPYIMGLVPIILPNVEKFHL